MADNSNQSPLFGDMTDMSRTPAVPVSSTTPASPVPVVEPTQTSDSLATILGGGIPAAPSTTVSAPSEVPAVPPTPETSSPIPAAAPLPSSADSMASILSSLSTATPPVIPMDMPAEPMHSPLSPSVISEVQSDPIPVVPVSEKPQEENATQKVSEIAPSPSEPVTPSVPLPSENVSEEDPRLKHYLEEDVIYNSMLRIIDADRIRLRLAIRYMILMFAIFLVIVWIVNNRIIMFGFSEFQWLARIRDALFGVIAGLFSLTIWFGSEVWFHKWFLVWFFRIISLVFFAAVLSALYFPLW